MSPQHWLAIGPSVVALGVALISAWVQRQSRIADDIRFKDQRDFDENRWIASTETDDRRRADERAHSMASESRDVRRKDLNARVERLHAESTTFLAVFAEALVAAGRVCRQLHVFASQGLWTEWEHVYEIWSPDLTTRFAAAAAAVELHDEAIAAVARRAREELSSTVHEVLGYYADRRAPGISDIVLTAQEEIEFAAAVRAKIDALREEADQIEAGGPAAASE